MKKVRCPKCDQFIPFDETKYADGQSLVFVCPNCLKQFSIRMGTRKNAAADGSVAESEPPRTYGRLVVVENQFCYRHEVTLTEGDNIIGRRNKGSDIPIPIETNDPSMDRRHCIINVRLNGVGEPVFTLRDNDSRTGTFLMNEILGPRDRMVLDDGAIITMGATTIIFHKE